MDPSCSVAKIIGAYLDFSSVTRQAVATETKAIVTVVRLVKDCIQTSLRYKWNSNLDLRWSR